MAGRAMESERRRQTRAELGLTTDEDARRIDAAMGQEELRRKKKAARRMLLETQPSYKLVRGIAVVMDKYMLDPIVGIVYPPLGDLLTVVMCVPFLYVALFKVRSIPLTLAVVYNTMVDVLLGFVPVVGDLIDVFNKSYAKNYNLIVGFVEDDARVVRATNRKAAWLVAAIAVVGLMTWGLAVLVSEFVAWVQGLF